MKTLPKPLRLFLVAGLLAGALTSAVPASSGVRVELIHEAALGYLGCHRTLDFATQYCIAAVEADDAVRVMVLIRGGLGLTSNGLLLPGVDRVLEATLAPEALRVDPVAGLARLSSTIPGLGDVDVYARAFGRGPFSTNSHCAEGFAYEIESAPRLGIMGSSQDPGVIADRPVTSGCVSFWSDPANGSWRILTSS